MTETQDPMEIYRAALDAIQLVEEQAPPTIERAEVWPYPDLQRLWVRVQVGAFARYPDLTFTVTDPAGDVVCSMYMVEIREPYQSITLHLRRAPQPGAGYLLEINLARDDAVLDTHSVPFELTFREPENQK